jgi:3' terminal RNA ribose 2'-O-methyltransferase Hen1
LTLRALVTVHDALSLLFVLLPVLDDYKHYYLGEAEVDKLFRHGEGWLQAHPERDLIVHRYLQRRGALTTEAFERLQAAEDTITGPEEEAPKHAEAELERPLTLHSQRLNLVAERLKQLGARTVIDLGCGEGKLLRRLLADRHFEKLIGMDVSHQSLQLAARRLRLETMPERQKARISLMQGSLLYKDARLEGFEGAALVEVIEHLDPPRLAALERVLFEFARPRHVVITTPNREYNALFPTLPADKFRHGDHRFEWSRAEFTAWAEANAGRFGYEVKFEPVGPVDEKLGGPSQMAVFSLPTGAAQ